MRAVTCMAVTTFGSTPSPIPNRQSARCDHQDHLHRDLRLRPAPLRRLHPDDARRRHPRPREYGRGGRGRPEEHVERRRARRHSFTISCGQCFTAPSCNIPPATTPIPRRRRICRKRSTVIRWAPPSLRHLTGGYAGGQAEYLRVPYSDVGPIVIPEGMDDDKVLFLSDILPTGWMAAENAEIEQATQSPSWVAARRPVRDPVRSCHGRTA